MLERTDAIMSEVLEPITFVVAHLTVCIYTYICVCVCVCVCVWIRGGTQPQDQRRHKEPQTGGMR